MSFEVPGWREMRRRERASIWSRDKFTEGRSGRDRWEVRFLDDVNSDERSEVIAVQNQNKCHWHKQRHSSLKPIHYEQVRTTNLSRYYYWSSGPAPGIHKHLIDRGVPRESLYSLLNSKATLCLIEERDNAMTRDSRYDIWTNVNLMGTFTLKREKNDRRFHDLDAG